MKTISLLFFFSGIAALTYEVLWVRHLGHIFGNTVYAAATVMMTYMFGLALGSHFAGKWAAKIKKPVQMFGILEVATAFYALCVPLIFKLIQVLYRFFALHVSDSFAVLTVVRVVLALVLLLIPTAMMGATLPVLSKGFLTRVERFGSRLGILYGVNTLGAVSGVLLAGFVFIPKLGMSLTNVVAVCLDASVGFIAIYLSRTMDSSPEIAEAIKLEAQLDKGSFKRGKVATGLLLAIGASGFLSLAFEVVWFRALILVFGSTTYSFSAMLGVFLIGLSIGSMIISRFADKAKRPAAIFGAAAMLTGIYSLVSMGWFTLMPEYLLESLMLKGTPGWGRMIMLKFMITLIFLLVPTILFGASFTAAVKAIRAAMNSSPRAVGEAAMFNTIGAALGAFFGGFILLPAIGMEKSLIVCAFLILALGLALSLTSATAKWAKILAVVVAVLALVGTLISPPHWDKQIMSSGPYFGPWNYVKDGKVTLMEQLRQFRLLYFNEGITSTISVVKDSNEDLMYCSQGKVEADTSERSMMLQRMMGHLPMLFHPSPQRAVNIGLGAGVTFGAVSCYPAEHLEVVEFEPSVVNIARVWGERNHNVVDKPNVTVTINDGRNHLFVGGEPYDVITSDPFEPVMAGAANLYTVDFFELAKSRLAEGGIMAQYLPLYELSYEDYSMIMRSFAKVFPDALLFFTGFDSIMLGGKGDLALTLPVAKEKFEILEVRASLADVGFTKPEMLLSMFVARLSDDVHLFREGKLNTDNHPYVEFAAPKSTFRYTPDENQQTLLENYSPMPKFLLEGLDEEQKKIVQDSHKAMRMMLEANIFRAQENYKKNINLLMEAAKLAPENPVIANELGSSLMISANSVAAAGYAQQAVLQYELALKYKPNEFNAIYRLVNLNMRLQNLEKANQYLEEGLRRFPDSPLFIALRGRIKGTLGDFQGAATDINVAIEMLPEYVDFWVDYEKALRVLGDAKGANEAKRQIERLSL
ncbi:Polyamine aminopropyltransferase [Pontiella desulfatans]|uniref:Polyamine aminopropyltransferase n=1 Tax=Pontiella desulfatans TaxID=2750659 RepID=A0A6C2U836_PONDE|nr:fused MFS/spermidine synthase [Pontiella desulfatans]VGO16115.1 Polyamine aminopropyltransferase [Pontiella desulfatans]